MKIFFTALIAFKRHLIISTIEVWSNFVFLTWSCLQRCVFIFYRLFSLVIKRFNQVHHLITDLLYHRIFQVKLQTGQSNAKNLFHHCIWCIWPCILLFNVTFFVIPVFRNKIKTQQTNTCSKSTLKAKGKGVKYVQT